MRCTKARSTFESLTKNQSKMLVSRLICARSCSLEPARKFVDTIYIYIQGVSRLVDITAGGDFLGLCDQKSSYKHLSDFGRLRSYDRLKLRIEGNDY